MAHDVVALAGAGSLLASSAVYRLHTGAVMVWGMDEGNKLVSSRVVCAPVMPCQL